MKIWLHAEGPKVRRAEPGSVVRRSWFPAPLHYLALLVRPRFLAMLTWPNLSCAGDWIAYPHPALFLERACVTGIAAATRAAAALGKDLLPPVPPARPEPLARAFETVLRSVRDMLRR